MVMMLIASESRPRPANDVQDIALLASLCGGSGVKGRCFFKVHVTK